MRASAAMRALTELRAIARDPALLLWSLYILLSPVYIFPSGLPQPGDVLLIPLAFVTFASWNRRASHVLRGPAFALAAFTAYVVLNNLAWTAISGNVELNLKHSFVLSPLFYLYNFVAFLVGLLMWSKYSMRFVWVTVWMTIASLFVQTFVVSFFSGTASDGARMTGLFNNPNQLGYFAVLCASIILLGQRSLKLRSWTVTAALLCAAYLALLSASKAALGSVAIIVIVGMMSRLRTILIASVACALALALFDPAGDAFQAASDRIRNDSSGGLFEERGYDRITSHPEYWLLGAGEGNYSRFAETNFIGDHELHSSAGTVFFAYGLVGSVLFLWFVTRLVSGALIRNAVLLLPAAAYGLTHQGLRVTLFWMLLALFLSLKEAHLRAAWARRTLEKH